MIFLAHKIFFTIGKVLGGTVQNGKIFKTFSVSVKRLILSFNPFI